MYNEYDINEDDTVEVSVGCGCCLISMLLMLIISSGLVSILIGLGKFIYNLMF